MQRDQIKKQNKQKKTIEVNLKKSTLSTGAGFLLYYILFFKLLNSFTATPKNTGPRCEATVVNIPGVCGLICLLTGGEDAPKREVAWPRWKQDDEEGGGGRAGRIPVVADEAEIPVFFDVRRHLWRTRERKVGHEKLHQSRWFSV